MDFKKVFKSKLFLILSIIIPIVFLDQLTKQIIHNTMLLHESVPVISGFFNLTYISNTGSAWGFLSTLNPSIRIPFFWSISILAILLISIYLYKVPINKKLNIWTFSLILSGALGNFLDRLEIFHKGGYVIDFLDFYVRIGGKNYHWPAFNIADSAISTAICLLILLAIKEEREKKKNKQ